jgi:hypothetical protein
LGGASRRGEHGGQLGWSPGASRVPVVRHKGAAFAQGLEKVLPTRGTGRETLWGNQPV